MSLRAILRWLLTIGMVLAGANHFIDPGMYLAMMPPYLPWHLELVYISGVFEIVGGLGLIHPSTRRLAGWGLIALFVAIFPANLHMALNELPLDGRPVPPWALWVRLPLQMVLIVWAWWVSRPARPARSASVAPAA